MLKNTIHLTAYNEDKFLTISLRYLLWLIISGKINIFLINQGLNFSFYYLLL